MRLIDIQNFMACNVATITKNPNNIFILGPSRKIPSKKIRRPPEILINTKIVSQHIINEVMSSVLTKFNLKNVKKRKNFTKTKKFSQKN